MSGLRICALFVVWLACLFSICPSAAAVAAPFPEYDCIAPNVNFWTKVYSEYTTSQGIIHDSINLNIVYDTIDLRPYDTPNARKINRKRMKRAQQKYEGILMRLSRHPETSDAECRRVAALFGENPSSAAFRAAAGRIRCQVGQKDRFLAGLIRSGAYLDQIREIFVSYDIPEDMAYLPHVESSFNPKAYSKFGAAGMWQFTRGTGKRFMEIGYVLDERRDPIIAAHAAAQLLKENYAKLASWPLAITAYNHGAAGMERAKQIHGEYPAIFQSYQGRVFKFASRNFYSEFLAARQVAKNYKDYFGYLALDQPSPTRTIVLENFIALEDLQRHLDLETHVLAELNPALRQPVFNGQKFIPKGYRLRLPEHIVDEQAGVLAVIPESLYKSSQKPSRFYTVQRGDTAFKIARIHGVRLAELTLANNLNHRATIYPNQTLRIPVAGEQVPAAAPAAPIQSPEPVVIAKAEPTLAPAPEPQPAASEQEKPYPVPVLASIIPLPSLSPLELLPMQAENESEPSLEIVTANVRFEKLFNEKQKPVGLIQVEVEETLGHYAEWAQVRTQYIRRMNGLKFEDILHLHQKLKIPLHRTTAQIFEETRYEYHKRLQEDFFAVYRLGDLQPYRIERGDTIWTLCRTKFEIPMWLLKHCNPELDLADLRMNRKIWIPTIEKATADEPVVGNGTEDEEDSAGQSDSEGAL